MASGNRLIRLILLGRLTSHGLGDAQVVSGEGEISSHAVS